MGEIVMPRLSDTMEEGTILRWLKQEGELVARGEELVEIETDKAAMTYESDLEGELAIIAQAGQTLPVGALIAHIGDRAGSAASQPAATAPHSAPGPGAPEPGAPAPEAGVPADGAGAHAAPGTRVRASPLARRLATEQGVDLDALTGSGPGGRIVRADVEGAGAASPQPAPGGASEPIATAKGAARVIELTRSQQTVARRMAEAKATIPDFSLRSEVDMEAAAELRAQLKGLSGEHHGLGVPTYNDMVVKAAALALREHPRANAGYRDGTVLLHGRVNVGVAVAAAETLVVPTVFDADEKSLGEIARETRELAGRVRDGTITPPQLGGGTFTVSNLGMHGVESFTPIINPPQAAILAVGALAPRAVVRDGELQARRTLVLTLVCDHRVLYGADAAELLSRIRELLETPSALTL